MFFSPLICSSELPYHRCHCVCAVINRKVYISASFSCWIQSHSSSCTLFSDGRRLTSELLLFQMKCRILAANFGWFTPTLLNKCKLIRNCSSFRCLSSVVCFNIMEKGLLMADVLSYSNREKGYMCFTDMTYWCTWMERSHHWIPVVFCFFTLWLYKSLETWHRFGGECVMTQAFISGWTETRKHDVSSAEFNWTRLNSGFNMRNDGFSQHIWIIKFKFP